MKKPALPVLIEYIIHVNPQSVESARIGQRQAAIKFGMEISIVLTVECSGKSASFRALAIIRSRLCDRIAYTPDQNLSLIHSENRSALFPLNTVLFPGCTLPLQIFEQRYLRLIKSCMRDNHGFVVILISAGKEVGDTPETYSIGTYVDIVDWEMLDNGLFGITIEARHRVRVTHPCAQDDGLMTGEIEPLPYTDEAEIDSVTRIPDLIDTLKQLEQHPYAEQQALEPDYASTQDVCHKLSQLLPLDPLVKQSLLEINSTEEKIDRLRDLIQRIQT